MIAIQARIEDALELLGEGWRPPRLASESFKSGWARLTRCSSRRALRLEELQLEIQFHVVADEHTACFQRCVPGEPEIAALDFGLSGRTDASVSPGIFRLVRNFLD